MRTARAALTVVPAVAVVLLAGAPGALASHRPTPSRSSPPARSSQPPSPSSPGISATYGLPTSWPGTCQALGSVPNTAATSVSGEPWAQQALDFSSVWGLTEGRGVTVAVVDSGVDYVPQLAGRGWYKDVTGTGPDDCVGHGTAVASIIAASDERLDGIPFYGVAPAARILSVKVNVTDNGSPTLLAEGIRDAAELGAQVINVSVQTPDNIPQLRAAVQYALSRNAVVVAAAGNDLETTGHGPFYPASYSASYPGVISVAALDQGGAVISQTDPYTPISVAAPGEDVASDWPGGFSPANVGTSFAAAFVSGEAALIRSAFPRLSGPQVAARIISTADGNTGAHTGAGMIDPVEAVTGVLPATPPPAGTPRPVSIPAVPRGNRVTRLVAVSVIGGAVALAFLAVAGAIVVPPGRRRRWRPGRLDLRAIERAPAATGPDWGDEGPPGRELPARTGPAAPPGPRSLPPG
jgi:membrane-anchored mycosin MYCP